MPIDPSIALQVKRPEFMSPAQAISLQQLARQGQMQQMQLQEAQRTQQAQNQLRELFASGKQPTPQELMAIDPKTGMEFQKNQLAQQVQQSTIERNRAQTAASQQRMTADQFKVVKEKGDLLQKEAEGSLLVYEQAVAKGIPEQQARDLAQQDRTERLDRLSKSGQFSGDELAKLDPSFDPAKVRSNVMKYQDWLKQQQEARKEQETQKRDVLAERRMELSERRANALMAKVSAGEVEDAKLQPEERRFLAEQALSGDTSVFQNIGRGKQGAANIVALRREMMQVAKEKGMSPEDVAMRNAEFFGMKAGERTVGTRQAQIEMAGQVLSQFIPIAKQASDAYQRTGIKSVNDLQKAIQSRTASPELRKLNASVNAVINAYGRAINPTGVGNEADKAEARKILDSAFSSGDFNAAIDQMQAEIGAELKAPGKVKAGMRQLFTGKEETPKAEGKGTAPQQALDYLRAHPEAKDQFKAKYGYLP